MRFSPLKTSEEQFDLRHVRSPEGVNTEGITFSETANPTHDTDGTIEENEADIKPPSRIELVDCSSITTCSDSNGRKPSSQLHPERRKVLRDFPEPFYCECDPSAAKQYNPQLTDTYEADSPGSSSPFSLVSVHLFVPSPTVPITGAQGSILQPKTNADPCCNPSVNDSPVWIENHMSKQTPTKKFYYCPECYQIIGPSLVSYDPAQPYRSADEENSCPISPSKLVQSKAILFTSESSETSSYSDAPIPWYKRTLCPCVWKDKYEPQIHGFHHPCTGAERGFDSNEARLSISNLLRRRKCEVCTNLRQAFAGFSEACIIFHKRRQFSGESATQNATNLGVTYHGVLRKTSSIVSSKRSFNLAKQAARNSLAHFGNSRSLESHNRRHARKALRTISFILGAFIICWTPYHIIMMIKGFCDDLETHTSCVNMHLYNLSYWLCYMNSPINPFCYALSNASFRRTFFRILRCDFQRK
ncbi:putative muscarinic acetylcholine receptor gar-2 [Fasciola gigantica]|uniref:Putative muscarinic acetylcholine receptor gar-2 n=1 Tax=Fasciola gigantica TaxID=46835 RepID=A0A504YF12_FASGI|nr:putative muscarinic acetylcholine receptor gar-2 [Fasciola gigantica]